jgi:hypothetical protein
VTNTRGSYQTAGGATTTVTGPSPWGLYQMPCTGCDTNDDTGDVPRDQAEDVAHQAAQYHAEHCTSPAT